MHNIYIHFFGLCIHVKFVRTSCSGEVALLKQRSNQVIRLYNSIVLESKYKSRKSKKWDAPIIMMLEEEFLETQIDVRIRFWRI